MHHSAKNGLARRFAAAHPELLITRTLVLAPIYVLGFSKDVIDAYIVIVGFQAVFNHANVGNAPRAPALHHRHTELPSWHHSQDQEALDRNYAAHFAFLDYLFGTAVKNSKLGPSATACWATTCQTASNSSSFRLPGRVVTSPQPRDDLARQNSTTVRKMRMATVTTKTSRAR